MAQKKRNLCLDISLNVNCLKIVVACISLSSLFNVDEHDDISLTSHIFNAVLQNFDY